jgi:hypothetical protein
MLANLPETPLYPSLPEIAVMTGTESIAVPENSSLGHWVLEK